VKVLLVDTFSAPHARGNVVGLQRAYERVAEVMPFGYRGVTRELRGVGRMNKRLVETVCEWKPDLVHLGKCELIRGDTIRQIKEECPQTKVIHFYSDMRIEVPSFVLWIGKYADMTLVPADDEEYYKQFTDAGVKRVAPWYIGTDPEIFKPYDVPKDQSVAFMANNHRGLPYAGARKRLIRDIGAVGIDVHVYGDRWPKPAPPNVTLHPYVGEEEFARACSRSKIVLGYSNFNVRMYTSWRRLVNTMSCGAFYMTDWFGGIEGIFARGMHLDWFMGIPNAVKVAKYWIDEGSDWRESMARVGRREVLAYHTWDNRVEKMMEYVEGL